MSPGPGRVEIGVVGVDGDQLSDHGIWQAGVVRRAPDGPGQGGVDAKPDESPLGRDLSKLAVNVPQCSATRMSNALSVAP
jgi:hypothetical protein